MLSQHGGALCASGDLEADFVLAVPWLSEETIRCNTRIKHVEA